MNIVVLVDLFSQKHFGPPFMYYFLIEKTYYAITHYFSRVFEKHIYMILLHKSECFIYPFLWRGLTSAITYFSEKITVTLYMLLTQNKSYFIYLMHCLIM
jgi:hypothetical protein